jgi:hypothetical protein
MRRRNYLAALAAGAAGIAGCSGQSDTPSTDQNRTTESPGTTSDGAGTTRTTESGTDDAVTDLLAFDDAIGTTTRERTRRALGRVLDLTGATLSGPIQVRQVDPDFHRAGLPPTYAQLAFAAPGSVLPSSEIRVPGSLGYYSDDDRTLSLAAPDQVPQRVFDDVEGAPEISFATYPNEPFLAHELAHAVHEDAAEMGAGPDGTDGRTARRGVSEGTADYVQGRYRVACRNGEHDPCQYRSSFPDTAAVPLWLVPRRFPYVNGTAFAHAAIERGGWERLWAAHEDPPETTWALMFPNRYFDDGIEVRRIDPHPTVEGRWNRSESERLGVGPLYFYLRALGVVTATDTGSAVDDALTDATGLERIFRSTLLADWRGDRLTQYVTDQRRVAVHWETQWETTAAAGAFADQVSGAYDDGAERDGDGWQVDRSYVTVERTDATVRVVMGPSREDVRTIREA